MPTYIFKCPDGHEREAFFKFAEVPSVVLCTYEEEGGSKDGYYFFERCFNTATRRISNAPMVIINKEMAPPSQRVKNWG